MNTYRITIVGTGDHSNVRLFTMGFAKDLASLGIELSEISIMHAEPTVWNA